MANLRGPPPLQVGLSSCSLIHWRWHVGLMSQFKKKHMFEKTVEHMLKFLLTILDVMELPPKSLSNSCCESSFCPTFDILFV